MLLLGFFDRGGARGVLGELAAPSARVYDAASVMLSATFGFALGLLSAVGAKHLPSEAPGALIALARFPHLHTIRPRLVELADRIDPLEPQCTLAKAMLDADDAPLKVLFVDDRFVACTGAKGWNTRRWLAEAGRDDTVILIETWRAICSSSDPPSGLSKAMLGPLDQLRSIIVDPKATIGFDRGGLYPKVFAELKRRGFDFVAYRRAPLSTRGANASCTGGRSPTACAAI
jgi:hypothetical protein